MADPLLSTIHLALIDAGLAPQIAERSAAVVAGRVSGLVQRLAAERLRRRARVLTGTEPAAAAALLDVATGLER